MARVGLAFRAFWRLLTEPELAAQVEPLLKGTTAPPAPVKPAREAPPAPVAPARSEALSLLSVLQREGRLVDFLKEDITPYNDAQVGAATRDVHRDCAAALERVFALRPLVEQAEESPIDVPAGFDPHRFRLTGSVTGQGPFHGTLRHAGWRATKIQLPDWTGTAPAAQIVAPAEVELK